MQDIYYFGAGPAALPKPVLEKIQEEFLNYNNTGLSVVELSHRGKDFIDIKNNAESLLRELMQVPNNYVVLFMHGGATSQFSMLPLNLVTTGASADYVCTGHWSKRASAEAKRFVEINEIDVLESGDSTSIFPPETWKLNPNATYVHYCDNETINGVAFDKIPDTNGIPLACDMTSSILTRPVEFNKYGLIYAGAQKNLGIAGLCVVIIRKDILDNINDNVPRLYDYKRCAEENSLVNTSLTFAIYALQLVLKWVKSEGGIKEMYQRSKDRSALVYQVLNNSQLYKNRVVEEIRSKINIPFEILGPDLQNPFLQQAELHKLIGLRGHKSVGGIRASLYNAMPQAGVQHLVEFMQDFEIKHL